MRQSFLPWIWKKKWKILRPARKLVIDSFHCIWYDSKNTWQKNSYLGYPIKQLPSDMLLYQELIFQTRPQFILQTGILEGGSLVYFANLLDIIGADPGVPVIGIDIEITENAKTINHPRIKMIEGSSTDIEIVEKVKGLLRATKGMVSLDSDHSYAHVLKELEIYSQFVDVGNYLVVEDTNINGRPVLPGFGPGPYEAVEEFLKKEADFTRDNKLWERNLFSFHQYGWLRREA